MNEHQYTKGLLLGHVSEKAELYNALLTFPKFLRNYIAVTRIAKFNKYWLEVISKIAVATLSASIYASLKGLKGIFEIASNKWCSPGMRLANQSFFNSQDIFELDTFRLPLVSVIIPAYNAAAFIRQTLNSVLSQTYRNIEVIVVDDGSQDLTYEIVKSIAEIDHRVILVRQSNKGVAAARNLAIGKSKGEYIAPIDADDIWHPRKIEKQVQHILQAGQSVGLVYAWWASIDEEGSLISTSPKWDVEGAVYERLLCINFIGNGSVPLLRRACIEHVGGYNSRLKEQSGQGCEDWDLMLRIAKHYQIRVVPAYLVGYRSVISRMSSDCTSMERSYDLMIEDIKQRHPEIPCETYNCSKSLFYLYLAGVSCKSGNCLGTINWVYKALCSYHVTTMSPWMVKWSIKSLLEIAANLVISLIWADRHGWLNFKKRFRFRDRENVALFDSELKDVKNKLLPL